MILKLNDKGTLVAKLQEKLGLTADGIFGINTEKALKNYQLEAGVRIDGIAGDATLKSLGLDFSNYKVNGTNREVSWELPEKGVGFRTYNRESCGDQFGTKSTIEKAIDIARQWNQKYPNIDIQYGDISYLYGGDTPDHATHEDGTNIDVRLFSTSGTYIALTYQDSLYSRQLTREFLQMLKGQIKGVYFNDPVLIKEGLCRYSSGHSNHLHLMF